MNAYIEEFVIKCDKYKKEDGYIYEQLGLDVIYDSHCIKIHSSCAAKIMSIKDGILVHTLYRNLENVAGVSCTYDDVSRQLYLNDNFGNRIGVSFISEKPSMCIGIITSGGDAPGMNAAIRSVVRMGIRLGATVCGVYRGYDGLINDYICQLGWDTETHNTSEGGTVLLSFRSKTFYEKETRKQAVYNLVKRGINCLVVLGGDGSLKGALTLKNEFSELFKELIKEGRLTKNDLVKAKKSSINSFDEFYGHPECYKEIPKVDINKFINKRNTRSGCETDSSDSSKLQTVTMTVSDDCKSSSIQINDTRSDSGQGDDSKSIETINTSSIDNNDLEDYIYELKLVGIPASIDNDIYGADYTLGADTAMNRVIESIDHLSSTMRSHQRIFVIETMGRTCGWLSLMSAFSCVADYVFIPEDPPLDWKKDVIENIKFAQKHGKPGMFIIISEGAIDRDGNRILSSDVLDYIKKQHIDVRLLKLGHVQRGGPTSAFDRILGSLSGIRAVEELLNPTFNTSVILYKYGDIATLDLQDVINCNDKIKKHETNLEFSSVLKYRGHLFKTILSLYKHICTNKEQVRALYMEDVNLKLLVEQNRSLQEKFKTKNIEIEKNTTEYLKIGILQYGNRSSGMNTVLNSIVQYCYSKQASPYIILNGFDGLLNDKVIKAQLYEFSNDFNNGGAILGLGKSHVLDYDLVLKQLQKHDFHSLIVIGDSNSLVVLDGLLKSSQYYNSVNMQGSSSANMQGSSSVNVQGSSSVNVQGSSSVDMQGSSDYRTANTVYCGMSSDCSDRSVSSALQQNIIKDNTQQTKEDSTSQTQEQSTIYAQKHNTQTTKHQTITDACSDTRQRIPNIILVPSDASNNIPYNDVSIGTDTALNTILKVSDCAKLSSFSMKNHAFVLEIGGGNCGYLTLMAGIAAGAFDCFIPERKYLLSHLSETAHRLRLRFVNNSRSGIVVFRNENTFCSIPTESLCRILKTDGNNLFDTDYSVLGRLQQGLNPTPIDRTYATLFGMKAVDFCLQDSGIGIIGLIGNKITFTDITTCLESFDIQKKTVHNPKWIKYSSTCQSVE